MATIHHVTGLITPTELSQVYLETIDQVARKDLLNASSYSDRNPHTPGYRNDLCAFAAAASISFMCQAVTMNHGRDRFIHLVAAQNHRNAAVHLIHDLDPNDRSISGYALRSLAKSEFDQYEQAPIKASFTHPPRDHQHDTSFAIAWLASMADDTRERFEQQMAQPIVPTADYLYRHARDLQHIADQADPQDYSRSHLEIIARIILLAATHADENRPAEHS